MRGLPVVIDQNIGLAKVGPSLAELKSQAFYRLKSKFFTQLIKSSKYPGGTTFSLYC